MIEEDDELIPTGKTIQAYDEKEERNDPKFKCRFTTLEISKMSDKELEQLNDNELGFLKEAYGIESNFSVGFDYMPHDKRARMVRYGAKKILKIAENRVYRDQGTPRGEIKGMEKGSRKRKKLLQQVAVVVFFGGQASYKNIARYAYFDMAPHEFIKSDPFDMPTALSWIRNANRELTQEYWLLDLPINPKAYKLGKKIPDEFMEDLDGYVDTLEKKYPKQKLT